jgi:hypothetical protein
MPGIWAAAGNSACHAAAGDPTSTSVRLPQRRVERRVGDLGGDRGAVVELVKPQRDALGTVVIRAVIDGAERENCVRPRRVGGNFMVQVRHQPDLQLRKRPYDIDVLLVEQRRMSRLHTVAQEPVLVVDYHSTAFAVRIRIESLSFTAKTGTRHVSDNAGTKEDDVLGSQSKKAALVAKEDPTPNRRPSRDRAQLGGHAPAIDHGANADW